jgi:tetratricopeptide (TPR) repeat protein
MSAMELFEKAEQLRQEEKLEDSLRVYAEALKQALKEGNDWIEGETLHMSGLVNLQLSRYPEAKRLIVDAKKKFLVMNHQEMIGAVLRDQAAIAVADEDFVLAESLLKDSILSLTRTEKKGHLGMSKVKLGSVYRKQGKREEAEKYVKEGLEEIRDSEERFFESSAYFELAYIQKEMGDLNQAKLSGLTALRILEDISTEDKHNKRKKEMKLFIDRLD